MDVTLRLRLLGPPEIRLAGSPVSETLPGKAQALLYYLAVTGQRHSRSSLAGLLWGEFPEDAARSNLRKVLVSLRQSVDPYVDIDRHSVAFKADNACWIDVVEFETRVGSTTPVEKIEPYQQAIDLYRGDLLAGFYVLHAPDFESWMLAEQTRLRELAVRALNRLADHHHRQDRLDQAITYTRRLLAIEPWREEAHRRLMMLLARNDQRGAALAQFETCQQLLAEELNVQPGEETNRLYEAIKAGRPASPVDARLSLNQTHPAKKPLPPCPYRGLFPFREIDAPFFFGRELFRERLVEAVRQRSLVAVIGPSGSGKSSVVFAGLVAHLRQEERWTVATFRPGSDPFRALAAALLPLLKPALSQADRLAETHRLSETFSRASSSLSDVVDSIGHSNQNPARLLLVADQFEELFTLCSGPVVRHRFLDALLKTVERQQFRPEPAFTLVLTLRADFLSQALTYRPLADALQDADVKLGPMTRQELGRAIEKPAEKQRIGFEPGLVERILDDVGNEPGNLPLLEFALTSLWAWQGNGRLSHEAYEAIGRVEGALAHYAEEVYAGLSQIEQEKAREVFVQMVRPGQGTEDTRRLAGRAELGQDNWNLVQRLADARLVVTDRGPARQETVELVHEALIRGWARLGAWMAADRTFRIWQEGLRAALHQWETSGRDEGALLRSLPLAEAENWLARRTEQLSQAERDFIQASLALRTRREAMREQERLAREQLRRRITQVLAAGLVIAILLAVVAGWQWRLAAQERQAALEAQALAAAEQTQTQLALARQLAALAVARLDTQLDLALLLSVEANRIASSFSTRSSLSTVLHYNPQLNTFLRDHSDTVKSVAFSPLADSQLAASAGNDGTIIFWDVTTGRPLGPPLTGHTGKIQSIAFSPNGQILASGGFDDTIILWDVAGRKPLGPPLTGHMDNIWSVAFSPDGQTLASGSVDDTIILWDVATGRPLGEPLIGHNSTVTGVAFSPDGQTLASGGGDNRILLWDMTTRQPLGPPLTGHTDWAKTIAFSPDGRALASGSDDGTIILWEVSTGQPLFLPLTDHTDSVRSVVFSPDGQILASAGEDKTVILWDVSTGRPLGRLTGHNGEVLTVAFSPDSRRLLSGSEDQTLILWDISTFLGNDGAVSPYSARTLTGHTDWIKSVAFSPDGKIVATGSRDKSIILWDVASGQPQSRLTGHISEVTSIAFSPDGQTLVSASDEAHELFFWDVTSGELRDRPDISFIGGVWSVAFSPDGQTLAIGSSDGTVVLWDVAGNQPLGKPLAGHADQVNGVAFSPDGTIVASSSADASLILWDVATGRPLGPPLTEHTHYLNSVAFSPTSQTVATGSTDKTVILWDAAGGKPLGPPLTGHTQAVYGLAFSPDGQTLASAGFDDTIILWDVASGQPVGPPLTGHTDNVFGVAFSPDGQTLASVSADHTLRLWDLSSRSTEANKQPLAQTLTGHTDRVRQVAFSPDGQILASAGDDHTIILWDVATRRPLGDPLTGHTDGVFSVAFSPDGQILASGSNDGTVFLWDITTTLKTGDATGQSLGRSDIGYVGGVWGVAFSLDSQTLAIGGTDGSIVLWDLPNNRPLGRPLTGYRAARDHIYSAEGNELAFSPDGRFLALGSDGETLLLFDLEDNQHRGHPLTGHSRLVTSVAFSPDGQILASASGDGSIILWEMATSQPLGAALTGHTGVVQSVTFSPDGLTLASAGHDGTVILWEVATGQSYGAPLTGHTGRVNSVAFSPDGQVLASGSNDGTVILWDLGFESLPARACRRANRNLTLAEWQQFFGAEPYRTTCPGLPVP